MKRWSLLLLFGIAVSVAWVGIGKLQGQSAVAQAVRHYDDSLLSKPTYRVKTEIDVKVPMRDGITLSADIYRPDVEGKFPAILVRTPYNNNTEGAINQSRFFAERGYVMIQQDVAALGEKSGL